VATFAADVRDAPALRNAIATFAKGSGPILRLYANAGAIDTNGATTPFDRAVFETNVYGVVDAVEAWLATSPPRGAAVGIVSSFSAFRGLPHLPAYGASKAAVTLYAESLRGRLRDDGLGVTTAFLGYLDSELASARKSSLLVTPCSRAAEVVVAAVERGATRVAYPPLVHAMVLGMRSLPDAFYDRLVARRYRRSSE
jgi:NAD(P)-dependent dehydrogenase (short-subunit alcohol dehydrogenase family)